MLPQVLGETGGMYQNHLQIPNLTLGLHCSSLLGSFRSPKEHESKFLIPLCKS